MEEKGTKDSAILGILKKRARNVASPSSYPSSGSMKKAEEGRSHRPKGDLSRDIESFGIKVEDPSSYRTLPKVKVQKLEYGTLIRYLHGDEIRFHYEYFDRAMEGILVRKLSNEKYVSYYYEIDIRTMMMSKRDYALSNSPLMNVVEMFRFT